MFQDVDVKIQVQTYLNFDVNVLKHALFPWIITNVMFHRKKSTSRQRQISGIYIQNIPGIWRLNVLRNQPSIYIYEALAEKKLLILLFISVAFRKKKVFSKQFS